MSADKRICVLSLGGTIAMLREERGGVVPRLSGQALVDAVPGLAGVARIEASSFRQIPGAHLSLDDLCELAQRIREQLDDGVDGVVVTQGTDTLEETAFLLDLLHAGDAPVVFTGAMRAPQSPGADGPGNLLAAVHVAADDDARGLGTLLVMHDEIHAARFVQKTHVSLPAAFRSYPGTLGWVAEERPAIVSRPPRRSTYTLPPAADRCARVALLTTFLGDDGRLVGSALRDGFDGLVIEATGTGHVAPPVADALELAAREIPVVFGSRTGRGEMLRGYYGFEGSESDLHGRGLIRAGYLDGPKARLLLWTNLAAGSDPPAIRAAFGEYGGG